MGEPDLVFVVDDDESTCALVESALAREGFRVETFLDAPAALERLPMPPPPSVVLTDLEMGPVGGLEVVQRLGASHPDLPVVVVTGHADLDHAVGALRAGAHDFLTKPIEPKRLVHAVRRASSHAALAAEVRRLRQEVRQRPGFPSIIGRSAPMQQVYDLVARVAPTDASVLVTGESGTGKELIARAIHERSDRAEGPFVVVNCAAVPAQLIESELFGHRKGAFTDAGSTRKGLFVEAEGGTLFLDEIGELPLETQPKLLRSLQERRVRPVGADREVPFDARIVSATNRVLANDVEDGRFREDLFYRINVVRMELPPLRERGSDVLTLAQHFTERFADRYRKPVRGLHADAARKLLDYPWPGNVRELENSIDRAVALARYDQVTVDGLPARIREHRVDRLPAEPLEPESMLTLAELEGRYLRKVLRAVDDNKSHAARILGIDRKTLYRKLARQSDEP
ncbi:MAG: sigma-54-dependent transcriptional regulator [Sandaracinaceae bacterium]